VLRLTILLILSPFLLIAQNGNSPYSNFGLGEPLPDEYFHNSGMGGAGMAFPTPFHININPAFLPHNKYTTFELGGSGEYKKLTTQQNSVSDGNGSLRYLAFAFPITDKYVISVGLRPLTNVSYNYSQSSTVNGSSDTVTYNYLGEGGINSIYLSQGVQITKNFSLGLKAAYNFGAIEKTYSSYIHNIQQAYFLESTDQTNYRGFSVAPSIGYRQQLNKNWYLNAGGAYEFGGKWGYTSTRSLVKRRLIDDAPLENSTIGSDQEGKIFHPSSLRAGLSIERLYKWTLGGEVKFQDWEKFNSIDGTESLKNVSTFSFGGQYVPDINAIKGYLNRTIFRLGVYYSESTFSANSEKLNDMGATLGLALPVGRLSFLNLAFAVGKRGTKETNIIEENYFRINLGVTLNDRWFVRRKFD